MLLNPFQRPYISREHSATSINYLGEKINGLTVSLESPNPSTKLKFPCSYYPGLNLIHLHMNPMSNVDAICFLALNAISAGKHP